MVLPSAPKPQPVTPQKPAPKPASGKATQTIKFFSNAAADLYIDGVKKGRLKPDIALRIALPKGEYILKIISVENDVDLINERYEIAETGGETIYEANMQAVFNRRIAAEIAARRQLEQQEALRQEVIRQGAAQKQAELLEHEWQRVEQQVLSQIEANMVLVEGGTFNMGSDRKEDGAATPVHQVAVSNFHMGKYEVTFAEYDAFCEATGRQKPGDEGWGRGNQPVINVSWEDAVACCNWLSEKTAKKYRLPTEAEWEYAARGGKKSKGYVYSGSNSIDEVAWFYRKRRPQTQIVGQKQANELGLYDMSGNAAERCADWFGDYSGSSKTNPHGPASGTYRVLRGGSVRHLPKGCRVATRYDFPDQRSSDIGFRVVRDL